MTAEQIATKPRRAIGPIGTIARVALALGLFYIAVADQWPDDWLHFGLEWYEGVLGLVAFPAVMLLGQRLRLRFSSEPLRATDAGAFCLNFAIGAALFIISFTRDAAALFYGSSLLLAAARGYAGCEVLAISNWLLRRDDQVGCVLFSPVDAVEAQLTGKARAN